jgi:hypothetical protein
MESADVLSASLVWRAGKTATALRTSAASCLLIILEKGLLLEKLEDVTPGIVQGCNGLLDDQSSHFNRYFGTQCLGYLGPKVVREVYPGTRV